MADNSDVSSPEQPAGTSTDGPSNLPETGIADDDLGVEAPPEDEEMPITEHIREMLRRVAIVIIAAAGVMLAVLPFTGDLIVQMWYDVHTGTIEQCLSTPEATGCTPPHVYGPLEFVFVRLRVAGLAGLVVAFPLAIYQSYRFMRPGLYPNERRYYLASVPLSFILGIVGVAFAYFVILPFLFAYFITYSDATGAVELAFQLKDTLNVMIVLMGMLAVVFQIPLAIVLAIMTGITTREWLEDRRLYFYAAFAGVAFLFGPDPTGMAPVVLAVTMVVLFEGTLLLLRWTDTG